jgi:hypothetical protein
MRADKKELVFWHYKKDTGIPSLFSENLECEITNRTTLLFKDMF